MAGERYMTTDHHHIREWVESREAWPATVAQTHSSEDPGIIRIDFPDYSGANSLDRISWEEWFQKFDESGLVFLYQETLASGEQSNFNKLVSRETAEQNDGAEWAETATAGASKSTSTRTSEGSGGKAGGAAGVDLNRASADELDSVFGIGPATARRIIEYRDSEMGGRFHSVHDLTHIPGIGEKTAELILNRARVE